MVRILLKLLLVAGVIVVIMVIVVVIAVVIAFLLTPPEDAHLGVLTEVGKTKLKARRALEAEYPEWKKREDAYRLQEKVEERFRRRYEAENE